MKSLIISKDNSSKYHLKGFTLIEVLVVLTLISIIGGIIIYFGFDSFRGYSYHDDRNGLLSLLQHARSEAMVNICRGSTCSGGKPHGVAIRPSNHPDSYVLFQTEFLNPTYSNRTDDDKASDIIISATSSSNSNEIVFSPLSGNTTSSVIITIQLTDNQAHSSIISINPVGQISWDK